MMIDSSFRLQHMRTLAGPGAHIHFTHLSQSSCDALAGVNVGTGAPGDAVVHVHRGGVLDLMKTHRQAGNEGMGIEKICLLDPKADRVLEPEDGDGRFEWFLFGVLIFFSFTFSWLY